MIWNSASNNTNNDLQKEAKQMYAKRSHEKQIMSENLSSFKINMAKMKDIEDREVMKENPVILEEREQREKEFSEKRLKDRKLLDMHYKRNIENNIKNKYYTRSIEKTEAQNSRSFLEVLNEK